MRSQAKCLALTCYLLMAPPSWAQSFGVEMLLSTEDFSRSGSEFADLDGDGDLDLLLAKFSTSQIGWSENLGGGRFTGLSPVGNEDNAWRPQSVHAADLNGDGHVDILVTGLAVFSQDTVGWYENLGNERFASIRIIGSSQNGSTLGQTADLDNDGDLDVVVARDKINPSWFENLGAGTFGPARTIALGGFQVTALEIADLNGDALPDMVWCIGNGNRVEWSQNIGAGNFQAATTITTQFSGPIDLQIGDLDGDLDLDLVVAGQSGGLIAWLENSGSGSFGSPQAVGAFVSQPAHIALGDGDGDGDLDLFSTHNQSVGVEWHENLGAGQFAPRMGLVGDTALLQDLHAQDIDGDGDADPITIHARIEWHESLGAGAFGPAEGLSLHVPDALPLDFDLDGDLDLLSTEDTENLVVLVENHGGGDFYDRRTLLSNVEDLTHANGLDVDGDGDMDLIIGSGEYFDAYADVHLYENLGSGFGPEQLLYTSLADDGPRTQLVDMDGDSDLDILVAHRQFGGLDLMAEWLINQGGGVFTRTSATYLNSVRVEPTDLDGDGLQDLLVKRSSSGPREITWFRNQGLGSMSAAIVIASVPSPGIGTPHAGDMDGDGNTDVVFSNLSTMQLMWLRNLGPGIFANPAAIGTLLDISYEGVLADFDLDGDLDPIAMGQDIAALYENLGAGVFGPPTVLPYAQGDWRIISAIAADLNGDQDLDLIKFSNLGMVLQGNTLRFGDSFCEPASENSTGQPARIFSLGSPVASNNSFTLTVDQMPRFQFGYFLVASDPGYVGMPGGSQGDLCVGGVIGRLNRNATEIFSTGTGGTASVPLDLTDVPSPFGPLMITAGQTRYFQAWYRDLNPGSTSNFTPGLRVKFE